MTRKDYVKIAAVLAESKPISHKSVRPLDRNESEWRVPAAIQWSDTAGRMADMLSADNPNFDRARFYKACGMEEE